MHQFRLLTLFVLHVLMLASAFEPDDCPGECHCTMDGSLMLVDCSGLEMTDLPDFPDNQVKLIIIFLSHIAYLIKKKF